VTTSTQETGALPISVGQLRGLGDFCLHTARDLKRFSALYRRGEQPRVEWDLRDVAVGHMSMASLTAFLATAYRLRQFTNQPPIARVTWNPRVFSFWEDIALFKIVEKLDLLTWPAELMGGFTSGVTNPNTRLLFFPRSHSPGPEDLERWKQWKDDTRQEVKEVILERCSALFDSSRKTRRLSHALTEQITIACAELVVNALLWGESAAFVGLQYTPMGMTVSVCDAGRGFLSSMNGKPGGPSVSRQEEAIAVASILNYRGFGLRRVIDTVVANGGRVVMWSNAAELLWKKPLWDDIGSWLLTQSPTQISVRDFMARIGSTLHKIPSSDDRQRGYLRVWHEGVRGSRISFEIPMERGSHE